jgi:uncharacterized protein (TIRG00374 family)
MNHPPGVWRQRAILTAKLAVTAALVYYVLSIADIAEIRRVLVTAVWGWLAVGVAICFAAQLVSAFRWAMLTRMLGLEAANSRFVSLYFLGAFFSIFLPTMIGGDVVKAYYLARETRKFARSTTSVFMDRNVGLGGLLIVGCIAATVTSFPSRAALLSALWLLMGSYLLANSMLLYPKVHDLVRWVLCRLRLGAVARRLDELFESLAIYRRNLAKVAALVTLAAVIHLMTFTGVYLFGLAIAAPAGLGHYLVFVPIIAIISMLPVSIGGLGLRESAFMTLFGPVGLTAEQSVTLGLLWYAACAVVSLPGGWVYLTYRRKDDAARVAKAVSVP